MLHVVAPRGYRLTINLNTTTIDQASRLSCALHNLHVYKQLSQINLSLVVDLDDRVWKLCDVSGNLALPNLTDRKSVV